MASLTRWTWVWVNSGSCQWTGRPGVLWFMGSQRVGHNWVTELIELNVFIGCICTFCREISIQVMCSFLKLCYLCFCGWVIVAVCIFWILDLHQTQHLQIFSHSVGCLFTFLMFFEEQSFLILKKLNIYFSFSLFCFICVFIFNWRIHWQTEDHEDLPFCFF